MFDWVGLKVLLSCIGMGQTGEVGSSGNCIYCVQHVLEPQDLEDLNEGL